MTNPEAADVLREYIRTNRPCNGLEMALQKAITALLHQPEPQHLVTWDKQRDMYECHACGQTFTNDTDGYQHEEVMRVSRETYWTKDDTLQFFNGDKVLVHIAIDKELLYRLVHQATKNKTRFSKSGPITVEAKKL